MKTKGFTLIELLVVISIIGLLASILLVAVNNIRTSARDVKRKADLSQLQKALEVYYDNNKQYPAMFSGPGTTYCSSLASTTAVSFLPTIINTLPNDPGNGATPYEYCQHNVGSVWDRQTYALFGALEASVGNASTTLWSAGSGYLPFSSSAYNYVLSNFTPP